MSPRCAEACGQTDGAGTHTPARANFLSFAAWMAWGGSETARECSSAERGGRTARWRAHCASASSMFSILKNWTMSLPRPFPIRCVGLAVSQAQCEAGRWRNRLISRHRSHRQAGGTDRQNLGRGTRRCGRRNEHVLSTLHELGADSTIRLDKPMKN